ncbi:unnamed protein product [Symbiodinium sp. CCMP2592]|nr:unnamed protein product [Symbiodinium sp. CCMP2592]
MPISWVTPLYLLFDPGSPFPDPADRCGAHLSDPALMESRDRQAAIAIAKRGCNVDRCLLGISPGGMGQSLYSLHLSEMYKHNHVCFDPNIWYLDEELRKQVETFARSFIMTGQEAPESNKKLHIVLYKKTISADGIMGRKPCGYSTKMFHTVGWARLEVNRIMKFTGVGNSTFNSMFRCALVWKAKARFIHKKFLIAYEDHQLDGIFEADPSLNKISATGGMDILQTVLCEPLVVYQFDNAERQETDTTRDNVREYIMHQMLDKGLESMTFYEFKKLKLDAKVIALMPPNLAGWFCAARLKRVQRLLRKACIAKKRSLRIQLRDKEGRLLAGVEEAQIAGFLRQVFGSQAIKEAPKYADFQAVQFEQLELLQALKRLGANKALPSIFAPASLWKLVCRITADLSGWGGQLESIVGAVLREGWPELEKQCMLLDSEIRLMWDTKRREAANSGTWTHAMLEFLFNGYQVMPGNMTGELDAAVALIHQLGNVEVYRTEWCIYASREDVAGSIDLVLKSSEDETFYLVDWKRSEKLQVKYNGFDRYMNPPLQNIADCHGYHSRLQLNMYKWILQTYYGIKVLAMKVVCVHPRYLPGGFVDDVLDLQEEVGKLTQCLRDHRLARAPPTELADMQPFAVELPSQRSHPDDREQWLEEIMDEEENVVPAAAKKRRLIPGVDTHVLRFQNLVARSHTILSDTRDALAKDVCSLPNSILHNANEMLRQLQQNFPNISDEIRRLILVAAHLVEGKISDKPMLADAAVLTWMVGSRHMRVHRGFLYIYDDDGCFLPFGGIPPEAVLHRVHHFFVWLEDLQTFESEPEQEFLSACRAATNRRLRNQIGYCRQMLEAVRHSGTGIDANKDDILAGGMVKIPHPLLDPVLQTHTDRLEKFYAQTFWCNVEVFRCCQAAVAIAKRGCNVDRCFIGISPGGMGQSLYSLHLSEMYKHNHVYFDPNIWYLDEELRKQVETFARPFITTGQEAPESNKKLHIDLYKKIISADGIMGRRQSTFNSMVRRALVWKAKAHFIHKKFLTAYEDHQLDGIFEADPSLNKFLTTSQASMGIRKRPQQGGLANMLEADADSEAERPEKDTTWDNLPEYIMHQMLDKGLESMAFYEFKKLKLEVNLSLHQDPSLAVRFQQQEEAKSPSPCFGAATGWFRAARLKRIQRLLRKACVAKKRNLVDALLQEAEAPKYADFQAVQLEELELLQALKRLGGNKALPSIFAPASLWKLAPQQVVPALLPTMNQASTCMDPSWHDVQLHLIAITNHGHPIMQAGANEAKTLSPRERCAITIHGYPITQACANETNQLEVNRIMKFTGVGNSTFNSMFRCALVWKAKARFIHKKFLIAYEDHQLDGIFEADPSLNKFLTTSQNVQEGLANMLEADADSEAERQETDTTRDNVREYIMHQMLDKGLESMTFYEFKKLKLDAKDHPNLSKSTGITC